MIRLLLVDDQPLVRAGLRMVFEPESDVEVAGEAADGDEAVWRARELGPDVVLMDLRMPRRDGIQATRAILGGDGGAETPRVLVLTTFDDDEYVYEALRAGASGFLLKDAPPEALVAAVRGVVAGDALLAPAVTRRLVAGFARRRPLPPGLNELTEREREVFDLVARGLSNAEIAERLHVGESTVKTHVGHVLSKLELRDRVQAVVLAYEAGIVEPGSRPPPRGGDDLPPAGDDRRAGRP